MDMVLSKRSFDVVISDAIVLVSPGKIMRLPPATSFLLAYEKILTDRIKDVT